MQHDELKYPYDVSMLLDVMAANALARGRRAVEHPAKIVIIDSGLYTFRRDETIFRDVLSIDRPSISELNRKKFLEENAPRLPRADDAAHGTGVATLALGGPLLARVLAADTGEPRIWIEAYRIHESRGGRVVIPADKLPDIFRNSQPRGKTTVFNLSLRTDKTLSSVLDRLGDKGPDYLFVVAAGNSGRQLTRTDENEGTRLPQIPATYGGIGNEGEANLIAVAALVSNEGRWKRAHFSDYSPAFIEIGAPGCSIPVVKYIRDEEAWAQENRLESGTSFAAPLVSFTAGLILAERPDMDAARVKQRLLAGADLNETLIKDVADGRSLNVIKATSIYHDVLATNDRIMRGWLRYIRAGSGEALGANDQLPIKCAEVESGLRVSEILKIAPGFLKRAGMPLGEQFPDRVYAVRGAKRQLAVFSCKLGEDIEVSFQRLGTSGAPGYRWDEIIDLIPKIN